MGPEQGSVSITIMNSGDPLRPLGRTRPLITSDSCAVGSHWCHWNPWVTENTEVYVAMPRSEKKKYNTAETSLAEVPQVMKTHPSQGADKHHILSSSLHSFLLFCPLCHNNWSTQGHLSANWTDCHVVYFVRVLQKRLQRVFMLV